MASSPPEPGYARSRVGGQAQEVTGPVSAMRGPLWERIRRHAHDHGQLYACAPKRARFSLQGVIPARVIGSPGARHVQCMPSLSEPRQGVTHREPSVSGVCGMQPCHRLLLQRSGPMVGRHGLSGAAVVEPASGCDNRRMAPQWGHGRHGWCVVRGDPRGPLPSKGGQARAPRNIACRPCPTARGHLAE